MVDPEAVAPPTYRFGDFELDVGAERLSRAGLTITLAPQPLALLRLLVENAGRLVTREEAREQLWGERVVEHDQGLNFCLSQVRKALEDRPERPRYIETVPRRGYRFVATVERRDAGAAGPGRRRRIAAVALFLIVGAVAIAMLWPRAPVAMIAVEPLQTAGVELERYVGDAFTQRLRDALAASDRIDIVNDLDARDDRWQLSLGTRLVRVDQGLRLEAALTRAGATMPVWEASMRVDEQRLEALETELARELHQVVGRLLSDDLPEREAVERTRERSAPR